MASFLGAETSLRGGEYADLRSRTSERPFGYLTRFVPVGTCPREYPWTCGFNEGGSHVTTPDMRLGKGLSRVRGAARPDAQLVGPAIFQHGNGDRTLADDDTTLRIGKYRVLRGTNKPCAKLQTHAKFQQAQTPWTTFQGTVERGRHKYEQAVTCLSCRLTPPDCRAMPSSIEPFAPGGVSTRDAKDFA
jgi:hypothetical protein